MGLILPRVQLILLTKKQKKRHLKSFYFFASTMNALQHLKLLVAATCYFCLVGVLNARRNDGDVLRSSNSHSHRGAMPLETDCHNLASKLDVQERVAFVPSDVHDLQHSLECPSCKYVDAASSVATTATGVATLKRKFDCVKGWIKLLSQCPAAEWTPPADIPANLVNEYTMDGVASVDTWYFKQRYSGHKAAVNDWDALNLDAKINAHSVAEAVQSFITYSVETALYVDSVLNNFTDIIANGAGIVWGSEKPWAEVLLARHGAQLTLTVEYGHISSSHAFIQATTPQKFASLMLQDPKQFDFAFTFSSLEHSGLGRYGDSLNPHGDIEAAIQTWCALKPGGLFFLGLPAVDSGSSDDRIVWNAHRFYGPKRLAQMFAGYEHIQTFAQGAVPNESIIHVLRKPIASRC